MRRDSTNQESKQEVGKRQPRRAVDRFAIVVLAPVFGALVLGAYYLWFITWPNPSVFKRQIWELNQFQLALETYKNQFGEYPPHGSAEQITKRLEKSYPPIDATLFRKNLKYELNSLDERESLYFWLEGSVWKRITGHTDNRYTMYEFDSARLIDDDNDGWLEYVDHAGNYFVLRQGKPLIVDRNSGNQIQINRKN